MDELAFRISGAEMVSAATSGISLPCATEATFRRGPKARPRIRVGEGPNLHQGTIRIFLMVPCLHPMTLVYLTLLYGCMIY